MAYKDNYMGEYVDNSAGVFPQNQFGGFEHTMFLGCSIMGFTAKVGWNQQVSELTVQLVQDLHPIPSNAPEKVYYDSFLNRRTTRVADPGFFVYNNDAPRVGSAVYFRVADFEFCGLLQNWTQTSGTEGNPTYQVTIVDPRQILENAQLIIGDYAGGLPQNLYNIFNVYGFMERFNGYTCASEDIGDVSFGSPAGAYGGSDNNANGMPVNKILLGTRLLTSAIPRELFSNYKDADGRNFSPYGRLVYRGATCGSDGYGVMAADAFGISFYLIDFSEVRAPTHISADGTIPDYVRRSGTSISIMELLNSLSEDMGFDYYIELVPIKTGGVSPTKIIKVRTVSRASQPVFGVIDNFIGDCQNNNTLLGVNRNKGRELRNEETTALIIGGNQQSIYQSDDTNAVPFFGVNFDKTAIRPTINADGYWEFDVSIVALKQQLLSENPAEETITIDERELLAAFGGRDAWENYAEYKAESFSVILSSFNRMKYAQATAQQAQDHIGEKIPRDDKPIAPDSSTKIDSDIQKDIQKVFAFISDFATTYYGKQFLVSIPYTCYYVDSEAATYTGEAKVQYTDVPSDGGWAWSTGVIDLPHPSWTTLFTLEDNRLGPFVKFIDTDELDFSHLTEGDYVYQSGSLHVKAEVDQELYFYSLSDDPFLTPRVVVTIPQAILNTKDGTTSQENVNRTARSTVAAKNEAEVAAGRPAPAGEDAVIAQSKNVGGITVKEYGEHIPKWPEKFAIPLLNTTRVYGPWATNARSLPVGTVRVEQDAGLVPWEYGNGVLLNTVGQYKANSNLTMMQVGEMGTVTVAGYPTIPLGAELGARNQIANYVVINSSNNRTFLTHEKFEATDTILGDTRRHTYATNAYNFPAGLSLQLGQGNFGPNITDINVSVTDRGIQTTYTLRTFTPKYGRLEKYNSERIKSFGQNIANSHKLIANQVAQYSSNFSKRLTLVEQEKRPIANKGKTETSNTPHEILVGQVVTHPTITDLYRTIIETTDTVCIVDELAYPTGKSIASLDVLLRPISINGVDNLPQFASFNYHDVSGHPAGAQPPVEIAGSQIYNFKVDGETENPFANPVSIDSKSPAQFSNSPERGHDIDIIGRDVSGDKVPPDTLVMPIAGGIDDKEADYQTDYKTFALRGPLMLQSWGLDLDGKPVPNSVDTFSNASQGIFATTSLTDKFLDGFLHKSPSWPVGPIDLRYDRKRGVWTAPPSYRLMVTQLQDTLEPGGTQTAYVIDGNIIYDTNGTSIDPANDPLESKPTVTITEKVQTSYNSGQKLLTYFNPDTNEYWPLGGTSSSGVQISDSGCDGSPGDLFVTTPFYTANQIIFGTGLDVISTGIYNGTTTSIVSLGLTISNFVGCPDLGGYSTLADNHHFDRILIGTGLHAVIPNYGMLGDPYTKCDAHIALAIDFYDTGENPEGSSDCNYYNVTAPALQAGKKAIIYLDDTITATPFTSTQNPCVQHDCGVKLHVSAAAITTQNTDDCPTYFTSTFSNGEQVDTFKFSKGLYSILPDAGDTTIHQIGLAIPLYNASNKGTVPVSQANFDGTAELTFGYGLAVEYIADCNALIWFTGDAGTSGVEMCNTETCPYTDSSISSDSNLYKPICGSESYQVTTIQYGLGLQYTHHDTTEVDMLALAIPFENVNGTNIRENIAAVRIGSGLHGEVVGSELNACKIEIELDLTANNNNDCVDEYNLFSNQTISNLIAQNGLALWQTVPGDGNIGLSTTHTNVTNKVKSASNAEYVSGPFYWGRGLSAIGTGECGVLISAETGIGSGVWLQYIGGCPGALDTDMYSADTIFLGSGLKHWRITDESYIGLSIPVFGSKNGFGNTIESLGSDVVNLTFGSGLTIASDGACGVKIDAQAGTNFYDVDFCEDASNFNVDVVSLTLFPDVGIGQGLGLKGHATDSDLALVYLSMLVDGSSTVSDVSSLKFTDGLYVTEGSIDGNTDCVQAEIYVGLAARDADACYDNNYSIGGDAIFNKISFEKGLKPWQTPTDASNGLVRVALAMDITAGPEALPDSTSVEDVGHLTIGSGLKLVADGECGAIISATTASGSIDTVGDDVCVTDQNYNDDTVTTKLIFGLGLSHNRLSSNDPVTRVGLDLKIKENKDQSGDVLAEHVAAIWLGPGLKSTIPETCAVGLHTMLDGGYIDTCPNTPNVGSVFTWNKLSIRKGLFPYLVDEGNNVKRLELGAAFRNIPLYPSCGGSVIPIYASEYAWGHGIAINSYGTCGVTVSSYLEGEHKAECHGGGCSYDSEGMCGSKLITYSGLCLEQASANVLGLSLDFFVNNDRPIVRLNLINGIEKAPDQPASSCEVSYMVDTRMTDNDVCYNPYANNCVNAASDTYMFKTVYVGRGLIACALDDPLDGEVGIGLDMTVGGIPNNSAIEFGECLKATKIQSSDCTVKVEFAHPGTSGTICVVDDVYCIGNAIYAEFIQLNFNKCGMFTGTSSC